MERRQPDQAGFQGDGVRELQPRESAAGPGSREGRVSGIRESPVGHSDRSTAGIFPPPKRIMSRWSTGILRTCSASCATHPNRSCTDLLNSCRLSDCCWAGRLGNGERRVLLSPNHRADKCAVLEHQEIGRHRWDTRARQNHPGEVQWVCG